MPLDELLGWQSSHWYISTLKSGFPITSLQLILFFRLMSVSMFSFGQKWRQQRAAVAL